MKNTCRKAIAIILAIFVVFAAAAPLQTGAFAVFAEADTVESDVGSADADAKAAGADDGAAAPDAGSAEVNSGAAEVGALAETAAEAAKGSGKDADIEGSGPGSGDAKEDRDADATAEDPADVTLAYEGKDYDITLTGGSKTGLTEDTALDAKEIDSKSAKDSDKYDEYMSLCETALDTAKDKQSIRFAKFYDITLTDGDGQEFEPDAPVDVNIKYDEKLASKLKTDGDGKLSVIHFKEDVNTGEIEAEVIGTDSGKGSDDIDVSNPNDQLQEVSFAADSFSVYAVVYTVDFHYGDGEYDFSIAGESSIQLSEVFERLRIEDIDLADIDEVTFNDPSLIKVEKAEGAESDWLLTSLAPFDTEETLTITLVEGSVITINVTDAPSTDPDGYVAYVVNGNQRHGFSTLEAAFQALPPGQASTIELTGDCVVNSPLTYEGSSDARGLTIKPAAGVTNPVIYRGTETGDLITFERGYLTIQDITIDGSSVVSTGALLNSTKNTNRITLTNVTVQNHEASNTSCAVEVSTARYVFLSGSTKIIGNTSSAGDANLHVPDNAAYTSVTGTLTNDIGITSSNNTSGAQFAAMSGLTVSGYVHFIADNNNDLFAIRSGQQISWATYHNTATSVTPRNMVADPDYGMTHTAAKDPDDHPQVAIPLEKTFTINGDVSAVAEKMAEEKFEFQIEANQSNPQAGWTIAPTNTAEIQVADILATTPVGNTYTYSVEPWTITFHKEGTYRFLISETDPSEGKDFSIVYDLEQDEVVFHVVEEEGILRIAESYRASDASIDSEQYGTTLDPIPAQKLFYVDTAIDGNGYPATVTQSGSNIQLDMKQNSSAVITSVFSLDFSRSFTIEGKAKVPADDSLAIAFQDNPKKKAFYTECNNALDAIYYKGDHYTVVGGYSVNPSFTDDIGQRMDSINEGFILQYVSKDAVRGFYSYKISGLKRIPYAASSGLTEGSGTYDTTVRENNSVLPLLIKFECSDSSIGKGKLTVKYMNQTVVYENFVASELMPNIWQQAYLTTSANVDHGCSGQIILEEERYSEELSSENRTSFWADRNEDGSFETQVNTSNSPAIPGETILVRHNLKRSDSYNKTTYERILIRQLKDITAGTDLTGRDEHSYPTGNMSGAIRCDETNDAYNTDVLSNGMWMTAFPGSDGFVFEYKVTAPNAHNHYVTEQALFGQEPFKTLYTTSYGFRTESKIEESSAFGNEATTYSITYDPNGGAFAGGSGASKTVTALNGSTFTVAEEAEKGDGWNFTGWRDNSSDMTYQVGDTFTVAGDVTLVAQWIEARSLTITNQNTGDYSNADDSFSVEVTLEPGSGQASLENENDSRLALITGASWSVTNGKATAQFTVDGTTNGDNAISIGMIPVGWTYTVKETADKGYTAKYKLGTDSESSYAEEPNGKTGVLNADTTVNIRSARENVVPSGISQGPKVILLFTWLMLAAAFVRLIFAIRRRKSMTRG